MNTMPSYGKVIDTKLKIESCPFCGENPDVYQVSYSCGCISYEVACYNMNKCGITPKTANIHTKLKDAVREWNKRWEE
mgnify:CR=1 FL=1